MASETEGLRDRHGGDQQVETSAGIASETLLYIKKFNKH